MATRIDAASAPKVRYGQEIAKGCRRERRLRNGTARTWGGGISRVSFVVAHVLLELPTPAKKAMLDASCVVMQGGNSLVQLSDVRLRTLGTRVSCDAIAAASTQAGNGFVVSSCSKSRKSVTLDGHHPPPMFLVTRVSHLATLICHACRSPSCQV